MSKTAEAFRTIGEVAAELDVPKHVLRFWEGKFPHIRPMKRGGGRRYYRPEDMELLRGIRRLLHADGYTIKGVQKILREQGIEQVKQAARAAEQVAETAGAGAKKRGRKPTALAVPVQHSEPATSNKVSPKSAKRGDATPERPSPKDIIAAAIRELQVCREILAERRASTEPKHVRVARS